MKTRRNSYDAKEFILDVAEEILIADGVESLKIGRIAERADMRHPNIVYHFGSIKGVRTALMNRLIGRYVAEVMDIVGEVNGTKNHDATATTTLIIKRIFKMYSEPYMPALLGWKLSISAGEPVEEIENMVEGFIKLTSSKLMELGRLEEAKRDNLLTIIHMVLSVCIGNVFLNSMWSKNLIGQTTNEALQLWVIDSVNKIVGDDSPIPPPISAV